MDIDLKNLNPATRFFYNKTEWVELRVLPKAIMRKMYNEQAVTKREFHKNKRHEYISLKNPGQIDDDAIDYQIFAWNTVDSDGNEIACTRENKLLLYNGAPPFEKLVSEGLATLTEAEKNDAKEETENL